MHTFDEAFKKAGIDPDHLIHQMKEEEKKKQGRNGIPKLLNMMVKKK